VEEKCTSLDEVEAKHIVEYDIAFQRLKVTKLGIHKIQSQLERMENGWGLSLYHVPTKNKCCNLNVCPVCGFWYKCHDHLIAPCGHSYHPWCMLEHFAIDTKCLLPSCGVSFSL
jgi:hypothetical protein